MPDTPAKRPLRIFLCHASTDKPAVRELYRRLCADSFSPWLDEEDLLPGEDWQYEIPKAVRQADVVIVCLSPKSSNKEGYVQKEIKFALDAADEKPEGTIFLVPLKLEECNVPDRLSRWQWVNLFSPNGYERLLRALCKRAAALNASGTAAVSPPPAPEALGPSVSNVSGGVNVDANNVTVGNDVVGRDQINQTTINIAQATIIQSGASAPEIKPTAPSKDAIESTPADDEVPDWILELQALKESTPAADDLPDWLRGIPSLAKQAEPILSGELPDWLSQPQPKTPVGKNREPNDRASIEVIGPSVVKTTHAKVQMWGGLEFVRVPAGKFWMGGGKEWHTVDLPYDYWLGRHLVTNKQFAQFVTAAKYKFNQGDWEKKADHPVVNVTWRDAMAYCKWLNNMLRGELKDQALRLPTEAEWEKAARGTDGNFFPWGNTWDQNKCNTQEVNKCGTTPVGAYSPQGDSPYGAADMAGNVWEWCHSLYKPYPYQATDGRENEAGDGSRVLRGGSWYNRLDDACCAYRNIDPPDNRNGDCGFRCCVRRLSLFNP